MGGNDDNAHLFAKSWNPKNGSHDAKENPTLIGKIAYEGAWVNPAKTADITSTDENVVTIGRELGKVLFVQGHSVFVLMNDGIINESKGFWTKVAGAEHKPKVGDSVAILSAQ